MKKRILQVETLTIYVLNYIKIQYPHDISYTLLYLLWEVEHFSQIKDLVILKYMYSWTHYALILFLF